MGWIFLFTIISFNFLQSSASKVIDLYGCRYLDICPEFSYCIDDNLFGHCGSVGDEVGAVRFAFYFQLSATKLTELELLVDLLRLDLRSWNDYSTQVVINDFLTNNRIFGQLVQQNRDVAGEEIQKENERVQLYLNNPIYFLPNLGRAADLEDGKDGIYDYVEEDYHQINGGNGNAIPRDRLVLPSGVDEGYEAFVRGANSVEKATVSDYHYQDPLQSTTQTQARDAQELPGSSSGAYLYDLVTNYDDGASDVLRDYYHMYEYAPDDLAFYYNEQYVDPSFDAKAAQTQNNRQKNLQEEWQPSEDVVANTDLLKREEKSVIGRGVDNGGQGGEGQGGGGESEYVYPVDNKDHHAARKGEAAGGNADDGDGEEYGQMLDKINSIEDEYSRYVDSKYQQLKQESGERRPAESFSISKSPSLPDKDHDEQQKKGFDSIVSIVESQPPGLNTDELKMKKSSKMPKREQITLYDEGNIGKSGDNDAHDWYAGGGGYSVPAVDPNFCFIQTHSPLTYQQGNDLLMEIVNITALDLASSNYISFSGRKITFYVDPDGGSKNATGIAHDIMKEKSRIEKEVGIKIESTGIGREDNERIMFTSTLAEDKSELTLVCVALLGCIFGLLCGVMGILTLKNNRKKKCKSAKLNNPATEGTHDQDGSYPSVDYQELCREHKAVTKKASLESKGAHGRVGSATSDGATPPPTGFFRGGSVSSEQSDRASISSWNEEPCAANLDITTGHIVLAYMESHLHDKGQLDSEWESLCAYEADEVSFAKATCVANQHKNRFPTCLPFDHNCISLSPEKSQGYGDYINASSIRDRHPERAAYILAQAPLENTLSDFWQMV